LSPALMPALRRTLCGTTNSSLETTTVISKLLLHDTKSVSPAVALYHVDSCWVSSETVGSADLKIVLGKRIRELRSKNGFSQESFADHCGLHRTYMGGIERGEHNLTIETLMTVAKGLEITMSDLIAGIEKQVGPSRTASPPARKRGSS
jgi:DNA-binding XRE family transcriptional regulator